MSSIPPREYERRRGRRVGGARARRLPKLWTSGLRESGLGSVGEQRKRSKLERGAREWSGEGGDALPGEALVGVAKLLLLAAAAFAGSSSGGSRGVCSTCSAGVMGVRKSSESKLDER